MLETYNAEKLDNALSVTNALCILSYLLFTTDAETIQRHGTDALVYTAPIVVYCLLRYSFKCQEGTGTGPVEILLHDWAFMCGALLWLIAVVVILLWRPMTWMV